MTDHYQSFTSSPLGKLFVKNLGLPDPTALERWTEGAPVVDGTVVTGGSGRLGKAGHRRAGQPRRREHDAPPPRARSTRAWSSTPPASRTPPDLVALQQFFTPLMRSLLPCTPASLVLGTVPEQVEASDERVAQRALEGFTRSLGKEIGRGSTVNLVYVAPGAEATVDSTLAFFLSPKTRLRLRPGGPARRDRHDRGRAGAQTPPSR